MTTKTVQKQNSRSIKSAEDYINSLRNRNLKVYLFGELVEDIVEHPMIRPNLTALISSEI